MYNTTKAVPDEVYQAEKDDHAHFLRELQDVACFLTANGYQHSAATVRQAIARLK